MIIRPGVVDGRPLGSVRNRRVSRHDNWPGRPMSGRGYRPSRRSRAPRDAWDPLVGILQGAGVTVELDVERLAAALDVLSDDGGEYALMAPEDRELRYEAAAQLAAEYARLSAVRQP